MTIKFDTGKGFQVKLSKTPLEITEVVGNERQGFKPSTIHEYVLENNIVKFKDYYAFAKVTYEVEGDPQQFSQFVGKNFADAFFQTQSSISKQTSEIYDDVQFDKINNEGVTLGNFDEKDGLKSLQAFTKIGKSLSKSPMVAMLTEKAGDGSLLKSASQLSAIQAQTGGRGGNGFLNKKITHASPKAAVNSIKKVLPALKESTLLESVKNLAVNSTKITTSLKEEENPATKVVKRVSAEYKAKLKGCSDAGLTLNPLALFGGIGREKCNAAAQGLAKVKGIKPTGLDIKSKLGGVAEGLKDFVEKKGIKVPDFIEEGGVKTNISQHFKAGSLIADIKPSEKFQINTQASGFAGHNTPTSYEFTFVNSVDELETEMSKSNRGPTSKNCDTAINALVVGWTGPLVGPPEKVNASALQEVSKKYDVRFLTNELESTGDVDAAANAANTISNKPKIYGIQPHYLILQNGDLQRGRPIDETRNPDYGKMTQTGLKLTFVAGDDMPINEKQYETFDKFIKKWITVFPGGEVFGDYELDNRYKGPNFNVKERVSSKYKKEFLVANPAAREEMPCKEELNLVRPKNIAKANVAIGKPLDIDKANADIIETIESKQFQEDLGTAINRFGSAFGSMQGVSRDKLEAEFGAKNLPVGNLKQQLDAKIAAANTKLGLNKATIDSVTEKLTKNKTLDLELAKQMSEKIVL